MLSHEACDSIIEKFSWLKMHRLDLQNVILTEASYWQQYQHNLGELGDFHAAVDKAHELIVEWLNSAHDWRVDDSLEDIANFVASTRSACVWAILISKHHRETT